MKKELKEITAEDLTAYRAVYSQSLTAYAGKKDSAGYDDRRRAWNDAKYYVGLSVADAKAQEGVKINPFAKVKPSGRHGAGERFEPLPGTVLYDSMEAERIEYMNKARAILATGTRAGGTVYFMEDDKTLDAYVIRAAKQDGMIREPLRSHPVQATILSFNPDKGEYKADKDAAIRWLNWRNDSILHYEKMEREVTSAQFAEAKKEKKAKAVA